LRKLYPGVSATPASRPAVPHGIAADPNSLPIHLAPIKAGAGTRSKTTIAELNALFIDIDFKSTESAISGT
jgi:hypothetical protein